LIAVANTKITELTQLTNPVSTDVLPIVDVGADVTRKISIADLLKNASTGTAASPGIAFDGDSNTGIYSPGTDQVAISTNGTGRLFVDASGQVIIEPNDDGNGLLRIFGNNTFGSYLQFADPDDSNVGEIRYDHVENAMLFRTNDAERARITSGGRLGLGTSSPEDLLSLASASASYLSFAQVASADSDPYGSIVFRHNTASGNKNAKIAGLRQGGTSGGVLAFYTRTHGDAVNIDGGVERLRIANDGKVGIGTTSPATTLDVNGDVTITDKIIHGGDTNTAIRFPAADTVSVETAGSERARIDSSGRLLVGTSSDSGGALLQVNGDRVRIATAKTPASASDTGTTGEICWDANYVYVCTATNTWKRSAISTW
jgi:hypothetical protein